MQCGICQELQRRRANGNPRKMYKSVANWWWINQHDDQCIFDSDVPDWVRTMKTVTKDNSYDEMYSNLDHRHSEKSSIVLGVCLIVFFIFSKKVFRNLVGKIK